MLWSDGGAAGVAGDVYGVGGVSDVGGSWLIGVLVMGVGLATTGYRPVKAARASAISAMRPRQTNQPSTSAGTMITSEPTV